MEIFNNPGPPTPVSISNGGTGASSTSGALVALGAVNKAGDSITGNLAVVGTFSAANGMTTVDSYGNLTIRGSSYYVFQDVSATFYNGVITFSNSGNFKCATLQAGPTTVDGYGNLTIRGSNYYVFQDVYANFYNGIIAFSNSGSITLAKNVFVGSSSIMAAQASIGLDNNSNLQRNVPSGSSYKDYINNIIVRQLNVYGNSRPTTTLGAASTYSLLSSFLAGVYVMADNSDSVIFRVAANGTVFLVSGPAYYVTAAPSSGQIQIKVTAGALQVVTGSALPSGVTTIETPGRM